MKQHWLHWLRGLHWMRGIRGIRVLFVFLLVLTPTCHAFGASVVDLSRRHVNIDVGFQGEDVLIFGALSKDQDIVIRVLGPRRILTARRYEENYGLWFLTADEWTIPTAPSFYYMASNRSLDDIAGDDIAGDDIAAETLMNTYGLGLVGAALKFLSPTPKNDAQSALSETLGKNGLWRDNEGGINIQEGILFQTRFHLPFKAAAGRYQVDVFTFSQGALTSRKQTFMEVQRIGLGRTIHNLSREHGFIYGILAVLMAVLMGSFASLATRIYR